MELCEFILREYETSYFGIAKCSCLMKLFSKWTEALIDTLIIIIANTDQSQFGQWLDGKTCWECESWKVLLFVLIGIVTSFLNLRSHWTKNTAYSNRTVHLLTMLLWWEKFLIVNCRTDGWKFEDRQNGQPTPLISHPLTISYGRGCGYLKERVYARLWWDIVMLKTSNEEDVRAIPVSMYRKKQREWLSKSLLIMLGCKQRIN